MGGWGGGGVVGGGGGGHELEYMQRRSFEHKLTLTVVDVNPSKSIATVRMSR